MLIELDLVLNIVMLLLVGLTACSLQLPSIGVVTQHAVFVIIAVLFGVLIYNSDVWQWMILLASWPIIDVFLAIVMIIVMRNFNNLESVILLVLTFVSLYALIHSVDLITFYIALEAQNFCFIVLCGLPMHNKSSTSFTVESILKFYLLSAFSSGVILYWFSSIYCNLGTSSLQAVLVNVDDFVASFLILTALMFKLGVAPLHLWVVDVYSTVKQSLILFIGTAPKLALFGFWVNTLQAFWLNYSVFIFAFFSLVLGSFAAYAQPALRALWAYSTVNEMGLLLTAVETVGFNSLWQHLGIYVIAQIILWNISNTGLFTILCVNLAALPPLAGFFGKSWIFWHLTVTNSITLLLIALFCAGVSLVYYLRVIRLFWNVTSNTNVKMCHTAHDHTQVMLTSFCVILLIIIPLYVMKPFIL